MSKSIQQKVIFGFTVFAIGPILILITVLGWFDFQENQNHVLGEQDKFAARLAVEVKALVETPLNILITKAKSHGLMGRDLDSRYIDLSILLASNRSFRQIISIKPDGTEEFRVTRDEDSHASRGRDWSRETAFMTPKTQGRLYYGGVEFDDRRGVPFMVIASPVYNLQSRELRSVIVSTIHLKGVWDLLAGQQNVSGQELFIMDEKRRIIAHQDPSMVLKGTVSTRDKDDGFLTGLSGRWVAAASRKIAIGESAFRLVVERDGMLAMMPAVRSTALVVMIVSIALLVIMLLLLRVLDHIARPIEDLAGAARNIGEGDFSRRVEVLSEDEIGVLGDAFNIMAESLEQTLRTLQDEISERTKYEAELDKHRNQLELLVNDRTRELREAQHNLVQKERLAVLGQLTATVSHELRNPLSVIRTSMYLIMKQLGNDADEKLVRNSESIGRSIDRCVHIIEELLDFTRVSDLDKQATALDQWLESLIAEQDIPKNILLEKNLALGGLEVHVDTDRLRRVVINVISNSSQAMQAPSGEAAKEGRLEIKTRTTGGRIEILVCDTGTGIPDDLLEKIFEPLFSTKAFGVGLGMTVVRQIMEQHEGGIEVESEVGKGTTVTLWLPDNVSRKEPRS